MLLAGLTILVAIAGCSSTPTLTPTTTPTPIATSNADPWPGVAVYRDSDSQIKARVNQTFSIVLPPAPLNGWGWQDQDLSAFSLVETKSVPGSANEPDPYGPDAFLFKALKTGTFQLNLYVPSKPPQEVKSFTVTVNP